MAVHCEASKAQQVTWVRAIREVVNISIWKQLGSDHGIKVFELESQFMKDLNDAILKKCAKGSTRDDGIIHALRMLRHIPDDIRPAQRQLIDRMVVHAIKWFKYEFAENDEEAEWHFESNKTFRLIAYLCNVGKFPATKILVKLNQVGYTEFANALFVSVSTPCPRFDATKKILPDSDTDKPTLILDMDETLIHTELNESDNYAFQKEVMFEGELTPIYVNTRPYLNIFMEYCYKHFEVILFTASTKEYADEIIDEIDPRKQLSYRLYRQHCVVNKKSHFIKDLRYLNRDLKRTCIIDNSILAFAFQLNNGIPCFPYYAGKTDVELLELIPFLDEMRRQEDFRVFLEDNFHLQAFANEIGAVVKGEKRNKRVATTNSEKSDNG